MTPTTDSPDRGEFLKNLRQSRHFLDKPVPQAIVNELLAAGRNVRDGERAGSWRLLVIDDLATKKSLSTIGSFTGFLAHVAVAIVVTLDGETTPNKANIEGRIAEQIMLAANRHGLGSGSGWFSAAPAQRRAQEILGFPRHRQVLVVVGAGYVAESRPAAR